MQQRAFSLRDVPAIIYVAIGLNLATTFVYLMVAAAKGFHEFDLETFKAMQVWRTLDQTGNNASAVLLPLGFLALARRQTGPGRALTMTGAALGFASLTYLVLQLGLMVANPQTDIMDVYDAMGYVVGLSSVAAAILLTIGAQAWRRVPIAAAGLFVLLATSYWVPVIGHKIGDSLGRDPVVREAYVFVRECAWAACQLFVAAALAAQTRPTPEPRRAAAGFRLARIMLVVRLYIAIVLMFALLIGAENQSAGQVFALGTPLVALVTMMVFAIALVRVSTSEVDGLPRIRFAIGAAAIVWWTFTQLYQAGQVYSTFKHHGDDYDSIGNLAIAAPIVAAIGLGLIGSGVAAIATHRGDHTAAGTLTARTIAVVVLSLAAVGLQTLALDAHSSGTAILMTLAALGAGLASLILLAQILRIAASTVEAAQLPPARVV